MSKMAELRRERKDFFTNYYSSLLQLSLPDNDQTWLYSLPGSDPNSVKDVAEYLCINSALNDEFVVVQAEGNHARSNAINTRTFTRQKKQYTSENRKKKIDQPNKNTINLDDIQKVQETCAVLKTPPIKPAHLKLSPNIINLKHEEDARIELNHPDLVAYPRVNESLKINVSYGTNNNNDTKLNQISDSWNVSERTLIFDISAPKGLMNSTVTSASSDIPPLSKLCFRPNSVSTPTRKSICVNKNEISINSGNSEEACVNTVTFEDTANDTYNVLLSSEDSNDQNDNMNLNITEVISASKTELDTAADVIGVIEQQHALQNTFIFEDSAVEKFSINETKILNNNEHSILIKDNMNNKLEEHLNFTYSSELDLNSTVTIKSKDNDSEQDSCYSSSSNIRSLGDVCAMSQLQPKKNNNIKSKLKKTRSEDSLCIPEDMSCSVKPEKHYGSALNLGQHKYSQFTADKKHLPIPNYFLKKSEKPINLPDVNVLDSNSKHVSIVKAISTRQVSKIPRPQSRIPKLTLKK